MLSVETLNLYFGDRPILRDLSLTVNDGERVALVGPNGAGKSTLLKVCANEISPDSGKVVLPNKSSLGYLPQEIQLPEDRPLLSEVMSVFDEAHQAMDEMRDLEHQMAEVNHESEEFQRIADRYDHLQHEVIRLDAYTAEARAARVLHGLGFQDHEMERLCGDFSGGWQMRAGLAKVLLHQPDVMLLDEPTNYLDIETMLWLESWLKSTDSSIIFVSHERAFMDNLADRVVEIAAGQHSIYRGNYTKYLETREERRAAQQAAYDNQQSRIKQIEDFASKFRAQARRASGVQSRLKEIDRMEKVEPPPPDPRTIQFKFPGAPRSNKVMIDLDEVTKSYEGKTILDEIIFKLHRGEKIALVGLNGAGKSTLIKMLAGREPATDGEIKIGEMTKLAYFSQDQHETLTPTNTVLQELSAETVAGQGNLARDVAGSFLFSNDDAEKPISVLSGGEKTRLRLAKMLMGSVNCLLLDEPTNHLDVHARGTLERALQEYEGAFVLVSHDRIFVDRVATKIYEVKDHNVREYLGSYAEYVESLNVTGDELSDGQAFTTAQEEEAPTTTTDNNGASNKKPKDEKKKNSTSKKREDITPREARKRLKKIQQQIEKFEEQIVEYEDYLAQVDEAMTQPDNYSDGKKMSKLTAKKSEVQAKLDEIMHEWQTLGDKASELTELAEM
jgi:ATP-binding cassette subfamily F protein 3